MSQTWKKILQAGSVKPTDLVGSTGSNGQVLTTNGSTGLSWSNKTVNTNTTYSAGTNMSLSGTTFSATDTDTNTNQLTTFSLSGDSGGSGTVSQGTNALISGGSNCSTTRYGSTIVINATDTNTNKLTQWLIQGDSGGGSSVAQGNTVDIAGGSNITTSHSNRTITINGQPDTTYTAGLGMRLSGTEFMSYGVLGIGEVSSTSQSKSMSTSYSQVSNTRYKVIFVAPPSGKVLIQARVYQDASSSGRTFYYAIDKQTPSTSNAGRHKVDETDDVNQTVGRIVGGLVAGTSYTFYLYAKINVTSGYLRWGSSYGDPYFVAWALP